MPHHVVLLFLHSYYFVPVGERSIAISLSVCLRSVSVCLSVSISLELLDRSWQNLLRRSFVAVARSSSGGVASR